MQFSAHTFGAFLGRLGDRLRSLAGGVDPRGIASVEYAVIAGIIALAISAGFTNLADKLQNVLNGLQF